MRKIFVVLIGVILMGSIFGVAQMFAFPNGTCHCTQENFILSQASVQVGDTFTIHKYVSCTYNQVSYPGTLGEMLEFVSGSSDDETHWETVTFRALRPGTITYTNPLCGDVHVVTIVPKEYPFASFMKLLGFGKQK